MSHNRFVDAGDKNSFRSYEAVTDVSGRDHRCYSFCTYLSTSLSCEKRPTLSRLLGANLKIFWMLHVLDDGSSPLLSHCIEVRLGFFVFVIVRELVLFG